MDGESLKEKCGFVQCSCVSRSVDFRDRCSPPCDALHFGSRAMAQVVMRFMIWDSVGGSGMLGGRGKPDSEVAVFTFESDRRDSACHTVVPEPVSSSV